MFSLTVIPPQLTLFQRPFFSTTQSPFHFPTFKNESKLINTKNPLQFSCFASKDSCFSPEFDNFTSILTSHESSNADFTDISPPSVSRSVRSDELAALLQSCSNVRHVRRAHAIVLKSLKYPETYVENNLISSYIRFGKIVEARKVFDKVTERNVVSWTAMINGYSKLGSDDEALRLFGDSISSGVQGNGKMFVCVMNLCSRRGDFELGRQIHGCILKASLRNLIVDSAVIYFYTQCGELFKAFRVFHGMAKKDVVCWTAMITACSQQGYGEEAFSLFSRMLSDGFSPNEFTVCSVLKACGEQKALRSGRQLHGAIIKKMFKNDVFVGSSLVDMYAKCGEILDARIVFDGMRSRNTVTWTSIIAGYARKGLGEDAISLFRVMKRRNIIANNLTVVSILRACGSVMDLLMGKEVHAQIVKKSIQMNMYIGSTLVWFYCKCGEYDIASKVLQQMPLRDVVSWTAMISGCASLGHEVEALEFLKEMMEEGVEPNSFTYSSALKACAKLGAVTKGKLIHSFANKTPAFSNVFVGSALIHMYAKCGFISEAFRVFDSMPERNLVSWKAMIMGYARNGLCQEALQLMYQMEAEGFVVDDYILATVLSACGDIELDEDPSSEILLVT
ncbi:Pentatricopeptide repeat-containing protein [Hibiscus syriacus]|uniref:Pentatricopeptide repeat-containing protein n=1 Tax=Hibiscus syriacus TaxID=106335 RepID=A0A6A3AFV0_HIBSY|nr:pentatricopeptide repeat-containing protein At4g18520, chloroplastic-like [Hibiscus syriacus]KAE8701739.1 Pentatricopeptide repeat-containing protein [Hibiscus syriacus]